MAGEIERKRWRICGNDKPVFHVGSVIVDLDTGAQWFVEAVHREAATNTEDLVLLKGSFTNGGPRRG